MQAITRKSIFILLANLFIQVSAFPQTAKYSNEFLTIGVGARALGMGNAFVASTGDVTSGYWNPAGLTSVGQEVQIGLMHAGFFGGISKYDYLGAAAGLKDNNYFGISLIRVGVDNIPNTIELIDSEGNIDYDRIRRFSVADYAFLFSYARKMITEGLSLGGNVKIIHRRIGEFANAWGFGLDAGARFVLNEWRFGLVMRDVTSTFNAWSFNNEKLEITLGDTTINKAPDNYMELTLPSLSAGLSRFVRLSEKFSLLAELNMVFTFDGERASLFSSKFTSIEPAIGIELGYSDIVFFRAGAGKFQEIPLFDGKTSIAFQPGIGLGLRLNRLFIDYSLTRFGQTGVSMYSNIFSLKFIIINRKEI